MPPKTDDQMTDFIARLLDVMDDYINFDYLVVQDQDAYAAMKADMVNFLRLEGI